jgi:hypothetical protein
MTVWRGSTRPRPTSNSRLSRKPGSQLLFAGCGKSHDPRFGLAVGPAARNNVLQDRGAKGSAEMTAALAPIEARLTERPPPILKGFDIEAGLGEKAPAFGGHAQLAVSAGEQTAPDKAVEHCYREITRQMIIAGARVTQFRIARSGADPQMTGASRHRHQRLERCGNVGIGEPEVAMPALTLDRDKPRALEPG